MSDAVATFLRASIVPEVPASHLAGLADGVDLTGLPARADYHGISGYVLQGLRGAVADGVPVEPAVVAELERLQAEARIRQLLVRRDPAWLQTHLEEWEVPWLVLKGPVLSDRVHPGGALRSYRDLDVLVSGARFVEVVRALGRAGAEPSPEARAAAPGTTEGELSLRLPDGTVLDLHQHILTAHRERFEVDVAGMLSRRVSSGFVTALRCRRSTRPTPSCTWRSTPCPPAVTGWCGGPTCATASNGTLRRGTSWSIALGGPAPPRCSRSRSAWRRTRGCRCRSTSGNWPFRPAGSRPSGVRGERSRPEPPSGASGPWRRR
jgi:hypothetical protein